MLCIKCSNPRTKKYCKNCYSIYANNRKTSIKLDIKNKTCCNCQVDKSIDEFSRNSYSKDGYNYRCKDCDSLRQGCKKRLKPPTINITEVQKAYLAGLLDGEGHLGMSISKRRDGKLSFHVRVVIAMTTDVLYDLSIEYGIGAIYACKARKSNHKDRIDWVIRPNECRVLLPQVLPYLKVKNQQAELIIQYLKLADHKIGTEEYRKSVMEITRELKKMNNRGKHG